MLQFSESQVENIETALSEALAARLIRQLTLHLPAEAAALGLSQADTPRARSFLDSAWSRAEALGFDDDADAAAYTMLAVGAARLDAMPAARDWVRTVLVEPDLSGRAKMLLISDGLRRLSVDREGIAAIVRAMDAVGAPMP